MAEAFGRLYNGEKFNFFSAGIEKHRLNPLAIMVMSEIGIDISKHTSKTTDELPDIKFDYVFTVCSDANANCPFFSQGKIIHIGFDDPPTLTQNMSDRAQILSVYRRVRDEIKEMVMHLEEHMG